MIFTDISTTKITLRIKIDNKWSAHDFTSLFESLNLIYKISVTLYLKDYDSQQKKNLDLLNNFIFNNGRISKKIKNSNLEYNSEYVEILPLDDELDNLDEIIERRSVANQLNFGNDFNNEFNLTVSKIQYASPGFCDFSGIGKVIEEVFNLIKFYFPNKQEKLKTISLEQDILSKKIENLKGILELEKEYEKIKHLKNLSLTNLSELNLKDKISDIELRK